MIPTSSISVVQRKGVNDSGSQASAKRQSSASPAPKPHAILSLSPALPQAKAPVPTVRKRRPLTDEEVAWHVIDNPGSTSPKDIPATAQRFCQEPKVAPSEVSANGTVDLDGPEMTPVTPPGKIVPARHEEIVTHVPENDSASSPPKPLPELAPATP